MIKYYFRKNKHLKKFKKNIYFNLKKKNKNKNV